MTPSSTDCGTPRSSSVGRSAVCWACVRAVSVRYARRQVGTIGAIFDALSTGAVLRGLGRHADARRTLEQSRLGHALEVHAAVLSLTSAMTREVQRIGGSPLRVAFLELCSTMFEDADGRCDPASLQRVAHIVGTWSFEETAEQRRGVSTSVVHQNLPCITPAEAGDRSLDADPLIALTESGFVHPSEKLDISPLSEGLFRASIQLRPEVARYHQMLIAALAAHDLYGATRAHAGMASVCDVVVPQWSFERYARSWPSMGLFWIPAVALRFGGTTSEMTPLMPNADDGVRLVVDIPEHDGSGCADGAAWPFGVDLIPAAEGRGLPWRADVSLRVGLASASRVQRSRAIAQFEAVVHEVERELEWSLRAAVVDGSLADVNSIADRLWKLRRFLRGSAAPHGRGPVADPSISGANGAGS